MSSANQEFSFEQLSELTAELENNMRAVNRVQAIIEFDLDGYILNANRNFLEIFSYQLDDIVGKHHSIFVEGVFAQSSDYKKFWDELKQGVFHAGEFSRLDSKGNIIWLQASYNPVFDKNGNLLRFVKYATNITAEKQRNADFESIVSGMQKALMLVEFDLNGLIVNANDNFLTLMGYTYNELIGQHHKILCFDDEVAHQSYQQHWQKLREGSFQRGEYIRKDKLGKEVPIFATYNPILDPKGQPIRIMKFVNDLSERYTMEAALRKAKDAAESAAKSKNQFLANMSHEIRTPMNSIIGYTELLLEEEDLDDNKRQHLSTVQYSARSLLSLLNDILDTAKLEHGSVALDCEDFSLFELCKNVRNTLLLSASQKDLDFIFEYDDSLSHCFNGDAYRLQQVLINLLGNAIKFTSEGYVKLRVSRFCSNIEINIEDTGIGIPRDRIQQIFDAFSQADASVTRRFGGTGLGTTISSQLIHLMGGEIIVESEVNKGSQFSIRLPLAETEALPSSIQSLEPVQSAEPLRDLNILVADDVPQNSKLLELRLSQFGHKVTTVIDGEEAFEVTKSQPFDVILMDLHMPNVDGLASSRLIRHWEKRQDHKPIPIIALTASVQEVDRSAAYSAGMNGFATKPVELDKLLIEISRVTGVVAQVDRSEFSQTDPFINKFRQHIDWDVGIKRWGEPEVFQMQLSSFVSHTLLDVADIAQQTHKAQYELAHKIKGSSANLCLKNVTLMATSIEADLKEKKPASALWQSLIDELQLVDNLLKTDKVTVNVPEDESLIQENKNNRLTINEWQKLFDSIAKSEFPEDALLERFCLELSDKDSTSLQNAISNFEFELALEIINNNSPAN